MYEKYLSFSGRLNRKPYWLRQLVLYAVLALVAVPLGLAVPEAFEFMFANAADFGGVPDGVVYAVFALVVVLFVLFMWVSFSIAVRRLHDRDKSAWWLLPYVVLPILLDPELFALAGVPVGSGIGSALQIASGVISLVYFLELGFLRGTDGPNRFGPDPLGPGTGEAAEVFA